MVVCWLAELFPGTGSITVLEIDALLVTTPAVKALVLIVTVADAFTARVPTVQVTVWLTTSNSPWLDVAEPMLRPAGTVSVMTTPVAADWTGIVTGQHVVERLTERDRVGRIGLGQREIG